MHPDKKINFARYCSCFVFFFLYVVTVLNIDDFLMNIQQTCNITYISDQCHISKVRANYLPTLGLNNCCFLTLSARFKKHQNQQRHWGRLQRSPRPLAGWEGASCPLPKNSTPASALRASLLRPPVLNTDRRHWLIADFENSASNCVHVCAFKARLCYHRKT